MNTTALARLTIPLLTAGLPLLWAAGAGSHLPLRAQIQGCRWEEFARLPVPVSDAAGDVDAAGGVAYIHGGVDDGAAVRNEVHRLDLRSGVVQRLITSGGNATRWAHGMAFHPGAGAGSLVVFGGNSQTAEDFPAEKRIYSLDPAALRWTISPYSGGVPAVQDQASAYDPIHGLIVTQGGRVSNGKLGGGTAQGETFVLDPASATVHRGQRDGPALFAHSMVYDPAGHRMLVFGGTPDGRRGSEAVWELSLETVPQSGVWRLLTTSGPSPGPRFNHGAAFDASRQAMVVYGGLKGQGEALDDTWALDVSQAPLALWRNLSAPNHKRSGMLTLYDPIGRSIIKVSGGRPSGGQLASEIYRLVCAEASRPSPTDGPPAIGTVPATSQPTSTLAPGQPTFTEPATEVPPPVTIPPQTETSEAPPTAPATTVPGGVTPPTPAPTDAPTPRAGGPTPPPATPGATPSPTTENAPLPPSATPAPPSGPSRIYVPLAAQAAVLKDDPPRPVAPTAEPSAPPLPTPMCVIAEIEPNDKLTDTWDQPPLCDGSPAIGILGQGDKGDYLKLRLQAGRLTVDLDDIEVGRDFDLLLYNFAGETLASSQQPGNLPEHLSLSVAGGDYALRVYPSTGRSDVPYELRWRLEP